MANRNAAYRATCAWECAPVRARAPVVSHAGPPCLSPHPALPPLAHLMPREQLANKADRDWYAATAASLFNAIQPEDGFKWPSYEPERGVFQRSYDALVRDVTDFGKVGEVVGLVIGLGTRGCLLLGCMVHDRGGPMPAECFQGCRAANICGRPCHRMCYSLLPPRCVPGPRHEEGAWPRSGMAVFGGRLHTPLVAAGGVRQVPHLLARADHARRGETPAAEGWLQWAGSGACGWGGCGCAYTCEEHRATEPRDSSLCDPCISAFPSSDALTAIKSCHRPRTPAPACAWTAWF